MLFLMGNRIVGVIEHIRIWDALILFGVVWGQKGRTKEAE
jgi:hypothetical protein